MDTDQKMQECWCSGGITVCLFFQLLAHKHRGGSVHLWPYVSQMKRWSVLINSSFIGSNVMPDRWQMMMHFCINMWSAPRKAVFTLGGTRYFSLEHICILSSDVVKGVMFVPAFSVAFHLGHNWGQTHSWQTVNRKWFSGSCPLNNDEESLRETSQHVLLFFIAVATPWFDVWPLQQIMWLSAYVPKGRNLT